MVNRIKFGYVRKYLEYMLSTHLDSVKKVTISHCRQSAGKIPSAYEANI